jgi:hypothetical protein
MSNEQLGYLGIFNTQSVARPVTLPPPGPAEAHTAALHYPRVVPTCCQVARQGVSGRSIEGVRIGRAPRHQHHRKFGLGSPAIAKAAGVKVEVGVVPQGVDGGRAERRVARGGAVAASRSLPLVVARLWSP